MHVWCQVVDGFGPCVPVQSLLPVAGPSSVLGSLTDEVHWSGYLLSHTVENQILSHSLSGLHRTFSLNWVFPEPIFLSLI